MKKSVFTLIILLIIIALAGFFFQQKDNAIVILYTNDVHTAIDENIGYAGLSAYKNDMEDIYKKDNILLVDVGDTFQGGHIGTISEGSAAVGFMNVLGYDYFVPGNHDFGFGIPRLIALTNDLEATTLSTNFIDLETDSPIFQPYSVHEFENVKVAFIGISTPSSFTHSTPTYFQNDKGEYKYTFLGNAPGLSEAEQFYNSVQRSINNAINEGADYVVALGHLGTEEATAPFRSTDLIENTTGIDVFIGTHSYSSFAKRIIKNEQQQDVILTQTAEKLEKFGVLTIDHDKNEIHTKLIGKEYTKKDPAIEKKIAQMHTQLNPLLLKIIGVSEFPLIAIENEVEVVRLRESNLANLVTDAYRIMQDSDIAIINAGSFRDNIDVGPISYKTLVDVLPFANEVHKVTVSGREIRDALEMGLREYPNPDGAFLQVSGLSYEVHADIPSSVVVDSQGNFVKVEGEYRAKNIMVGYNPLNLDGVYSMAATDYILLHKGDGMTMFKNTAPDINYFTEYDLIVKYLNSYLDNKVGSRYADPLGDGRIIIKGN